jgi:hypothetical protein
LVYDFAVIGGGIVGLLTIPIGGNSGPRVAARARQTFSERTLRLATIQRGGEEIVAVLVPLREFYPGHV